MDVLCCRQLGFVTPPLSLRQHLVAAGASRTDHDAVHAAPERDSGTPSTVDLANPPASGSRSTEKEAEGASRPTARPKAAALRQMASTPKRVSVRAEHRLAAQSYVAAPERDAADEAAQALPLQLHVSQAVRSQTPAVAAGSSGPQRRPPVPASPQQDPAHDRSPITSRQRSPASAGGVACPAAKPAGGRAAVHHDRRGHVPPPDHHAEAQTEALPASEALQNKQLSARSTPDVRVGGAGADAALAAPEAAVDESHDGPARQRGGRRGRPTVSEVSDGSDQRPTRRSAEPSQQGDQQQQQTKGGTVGKAAASLFSPVFSLFGGKAASDVPPSGPGESNDGAADGDEPARPAGSAAKKGDGNDGELAGPPRPAVPADDDVHSENDTQIRVPSGQSSGSQARSLTQPRKAFSVSYRHGLLPLPYA